MALSSKFWQTGLALLAASWGLSAAPITPEQVLSQTYVFDPQIAPDGTSVLFSMLSTPDEKGIRTTELWQVATRKGAKARQVLKGEATEPQWTNDGHAFGYLAAGNNQKPQLFMRRLDGSSQQLTHLTGGVYQYAWSPDGRQVAVLGQEPANNDKPYIEVDKHFAPIHLYLLNLKSGKLHRQSLGGMSISGVRWGPKSQRLVVRLAETSSINNYFYHSSLHVLDLASGKLGKAFEHSAINDFSWAPDGHAIAYCRLNTGGIAETCHQYWPATGKSARLLPHYHGAIPSLAWMPDSRHMMMMGFFGAHHEILWVDTKTNTVDKKRRISAFEATLTLSRDGKKMAFSGDRTDHPNEVWLMQNNTLTQLTNTNPQVDAWPKAQVKEVHWQSSIDDTPIYGVLLTPPGYKGDKPLKTVVELHGGPEWRWSYGWQSSWHEWGVMLASRGYAVLLPNPRGSVSQGVAFSRAVINDWGGGDYQDILDGVDMLEKDGIADPKHLGIGGWSYGGYMSAWAVGHTDRFKAAVVGAPPVDLVSFVNTTDTPDFTLGYFGTAADNLKLLQQRSPISYLKNVHTPVLVMQGQQDTRVPVTQGLAFYRGLKLQGKTAEMVEYKGAPHWISNGLHQRDIMHRMLDWFGKYL
ncbi:S9 family peptidase [Gallaecimonas mangrovi]|uniref:S9 family peptidase n=1 Tax=Gallaecimonas mangrovi TaxID=2291597 RepID=UPI000E2042FA|nr:S9 family peptidase [Gallaecimonas mangrovi]